MAYECIVISSGHGKLVRGASGILDEVEEARLVVEALATELRKRDVEVITFHDDISTTQSENLNRITDFHNKQDRDLDISVHFNAYEQVSKPMGTEVLYVTQLDLADALSEAIADVGFIDRGPKKRTDLHFLNATNEPSVLIETCFVDSEADAEIYREQFDNIIDNMADVLGGDAELEEQHPPMSGGFSITGTCSQFGGPEDTGVSASEGLAFIDDIDQAPHLFLPYQPQGTTGLARRLNPFIHYIACRWDYDKAPKETLRQNVALVRALRTGVRLQAFPADWGPHESTGRVADISPGLMFDLGITTDDEVEVIYPWREDMS